MIKSEKIDEIAAKISDKIKQAMPSGMDSGMSASLKQLQQETEKNVRVILQASFAKLDLVSREEFDIQTRLLERTREKLTELEQRVEALSKSPHSQ